MKEFVLTSTELEENIIIVRCKDKSLIYLAIPSLQRYLLDDTKLSTVTVNLDHQELIFNEDKSFKLVDLLPYSFPIKDFDVFKLASNRLKISQKIYLILSVCVIVLGIFLKTPIIVLSGASLLIASFFILCAYCIFNDLPMYFKGTHLYPIADHSFNRKAHLFIGGMVLFSYLSFVLVQVVSGL
ncbi:MAG: hypothetical protein KC646_05515 [Candidatus Cloacimonetes bacterium]|nr:hypothetical protein [Candidatus Cloacimonadota bacterium]